MPIGALSTLASQAAFRVLLDTLAHPGRVGRLDIPDGVPPGLVVPLALADATEHVSIVGADLAAWEWLLVEATGCRIARPEHADQVVLLAGAATPELIGNLRRGSPQAPEEGARVALECSRLGTDGGVRLTVRGPGVDGSRVVGVDGCPTGALEAIADANHDHPAGIDVWLVAGDGAIVGLPRSVTIDITGED